MISGLLSVFPEPAAPGTLKFDQFTGPNVVLQFHKSAGHVDNYRATIPLFSTQHITASTDDFQSVTFPNLTLGEYYNVSIVAIISTDQSSITISSEIVIRKFRVKANSELK